MNDLIYDNKKIAAILAENKWKLVGGVSTGRYSGAMFERYIDHKVDDFTHASWEKMEAFAAKWISAKNYVNDSSPTATTVVDPTVEEGKSVEKGTWYAGPLRRERGQADRNAQPVWRIIQPLFKGAADSMVEQQTDSGCVMKVYRRFFVDQASLPDIPARSAGQDTSISYSQDPQSGLFSGYTERRVRVYHYTAPVTITQDEYTITTRTIYRGVRPQGYSSAAATLGHAIDWNENGTQITDASGNVVEIPVPGLADIAANGTPGSPGYYPALDGYTVAKYGECTVDRSPNPDCSQDVTVTRKYAISGLTTLNPYDTWNVLGEYYWVPTYTHVTKATPIDVNGARVKEYDYLAFMEKRQAIKTVTVKFFTTEAAALDYIDTGSGTTGGWEGSGVHPICAGLWKATKITQTSIQISINALSYADPYADCKDYIE